MNIPIQVVFPRVRTDTQVCLCQASEPKDPSWNALTSTQGRAGMQADLLLRVGETANPWNRPINLTFRLGSFQ